MDAPHLHLALNHLPLVGTLFAFLLLLWGVLRKSVDVTKASLGAYVVIGLLSIVAYVTGEPAAEKLKGHPEIIEEWVEDHEQVAQVALTISLAISIGAAIALWKARKGRDLSKNLVRTILVMAAVCAGFMLWTGSIGGKARHSEIRRELPGVK